ncbi:DUF4312 family protein [Alicyclobacillus contaminans]|uniref:DUF4312 family protein n=1 Tax=Alicyclobacillus contaminans TaxID=392016 RepID=UPI00047AB3EF
MRTADCTLTLTGRGETREAAIGKLLSQVQGAVRKSVKGLPIRIEPKGIEIVSADVTRYTERFLGLLFPRERSLYTLKANVTVQVTILDPDEIEFKEYREAFRRTQRLLNLR